MYVEQLLERLRAGQIRFGDFAGASVEDRGERSLDDVVHDVVGGEVGAGRLAPTGDKRELARSVLGELEREELLKDRAQMTNR